jgi:hypothetical protein
VGGLDSAWLFHEVSLKYVALFLFVLFFSEKMLKWAIILLSINCKTVVFSDFDYNQDFLGFNSTQNGLISVPFNGSSVTNIGNYCDSYLTEPLNSYATIPYFDIRTTDFKFVYWLRVASKNIDQPVISSWSAFAWQFICGISSDNFFSCSLGAETNNLLPNIMVSAQASLENFSDGWVNRWINCTVVWSRTAYTLQIYLNGTLYDSQRASRPFDLARSNAQNIFIGRQDDIDLNSFGMNFRYFSADNDVSVRL